MRTATRVAGQGLSPIRRMALGAPAGTVSLGLGEPGWPLPAPAREALAALGTGSGSLPYGPNSGRVDLVAAVAHHVGAAADQVMLTAGSQAALFALFQTYAEPGTQVLVPDPGFVSYPSLARLCGAEPVGYPLAAGGHLDADALVDTLAGAPHTSLVVLNHPANPTGGTASAPALARVARACAERGVLLISDEVYRELWVDEPVASLHDVAGVADGVVLGSMSKAFGAPGLRVGWAVGPPEVLGPARIVHNAMTTAPAQPSQAAALALLSAAQEVLDEARAQVRRRWEMAARVAPELLAAAGRAGGAARQLTVTSRHQGTEPEMGPEPGPETSGRAGFYLWLPVPAGALGAGDTSAEDPTLAFALRLRDEGGVTTVPGSAFGARGAGHLRVSLGGPVDELEEGLRRLAPWWRG